MSATVIPFPAATGHTPDGIPGWARLAHRIVDDIERLAATRAADADECCRRAIRCLAEAADEIDDDEQVAALIDRLVDVRARVAAVRGSGRPWWWP